MREGPRHLTTGDLMGGIKLFLGAGLVLAGAALWLKSSEDPLPPAEESDVLAAADRATSTNAAKQTAYRLARAYEPAAAVSMIGTADRITGTDDAMLSALRIEVEREWWPSVFSDIADAADAATETDDGALQLLDLASRSGGNSGRIVKVFNEAGRSTKNDADTVEYAESKLKR